MVLRAEDGLRVRGNVVIESGGTISGFTRAGLDKDSLVVFPIPFESWRVWNSGAILPNVSALDDLGLYTGTFATDVSSLKTYDVKTVGATSLYARVSFSMPAEYVDADSCTIRVRAGMLGAVADTSCTLDCEAYLSNDESIKTGSDLCSTAAQSVNSLTFANYTFTLDGTVLSTGSQLDIRLTIAVNDGAGGASVQAGIGAAAILCDIRG